MGGRDAAGLCDGARAGHGYGQRCPMGARGGDRPSLRALPGSAHLHGGGVSADSRPSPTRWGRAPARAAELVQLPHRLRLRPDVELLTQLADRRRGCRARHGADRLVGGFCHRPREGSDENPANPHLGDSPDGSDQRPVGPSLRDVPLAWRSRHPRPPDGPGRHGHDPLLRARVRPRLLPDSEGALRGRSARGDVAPHRLAKRCVAVGQARGVRRRGARVRLPLVELRGSPALPIVGVELHRAAGSARVADTRAHEPSDPACCFGHCDRSGCNRIPCRAKSIFHADSGGVMKRIVVALVGLALLPLACSEGRSGDTSGGGGRIRVQVSGEAEEIAVYDTVVKAFGDANPSIDVTLVKLADKDDHLAKLTTSFAAGRSPDVFLVNFREYSQFVTRGGVEPFGDHIDDAGVTLDDYFPQPIEAFTYDDELQCMPQNISSLVVYYNRELFEKAGVPEPRGEWTWDE